MALVKCKECGSLMSSAAASCPSCGKPAAKKTTAVTWFVLGAVVLIVLLNIGKTPDSVAPTPPELTAEQKAAKAEDMRRGKALFGAEPLVKAKLKDGDSAKFGKSYFRNPNSVCGFVNAKNSFGAYVGEVGYIVDYEKNEVLIEGSSKEFPARWSKQCS